MKKSDKVLLALITVLSPLWVGLITLAIVNPASDSVIALGVVLSVIFGSPVILVLGLLIVFLTRKSVNANIYFKLAFIVPATIICLYEVFVMVA